MVSCRYNVPTDASTSGFMQKIPNTPLFMTFISILLFIGTVDDDDWRTAEGRKQIRFFISSQTNNTIFTTFLFFLKKDLKLPNIIYIKPSGTVSLVGLLSVGFTN